MSKKPPPKLELPEIKVENVKNVQDHINAREAELRELNESHNQLVAQFQRLQQQNQVRANFLEGTIAALKALLPPKKADKPPKK